MKKYNLAIIVIQILFSGMACGQSADPFLQKLSTYKNAHPDKAKVYKDIEGTPYLNDNFRNGILYFKDTTTLKLPLRYNIYSDNMEYQFQGLNYEVANPKSLNKIVLGESVFVYVPFVQNEGYFELIESGTCTLLQKKLIRYKPAEGPKLIQGVAIPAAFERKKDVHYIVTKNSETIRIENLKSIQNALRDQKQEIENFITTEKIKNTKKENLIKVIKYYNSL